MRCPCCAGALNDWHNPLRCEACRFTWLSAELKPGARPVRLVWPSDGRQMFTALVPERRLSYAPQVAIWRGSTWDWRPVVLP